MTRVVIFSLISAMALFVGAGLGIYFKFSKRTMAVITAFGSGALICALTFGLMEEAFGHGGFDAVTIGFLLGGVSFIIGDYLIHILGGRPRHRFKITSKGATNGEAITLGAILDGIPESAALGIALFNNKSLGLLMLVAIVLSNLPEAIASVPGLKKEGFSKRNIMLVWLSVAAISVLVALASYLFLNDIDLNNLGMIESFAAGAILAMLADTMMPEAYEEGGFPVGLATVSGFLVTFIISKL